MIECATCGEEFEPKHPRGKFCKPACRAKSHRRGARGAQDGTEAPQGLVAAIEAELDEAGRLDTFYGQLAVQLARKLASPDESGISSLSKELRAVRAAALEGVEAPPAPEEDEERDEVAKARRAREHARQAAGLA